MAIAALTIPALIVGSFAAAPFMWIGPRGHTHMALLEDHRAVQLSVGGRFHAGQTWADAADFEVVQHGVHAELQLEDYWRPRHVRYLTVRGGPLWHPRSISAGSLTVGYVYADGDPLQRGPEIGMPLFVGGPMGSMRFEPTYVISPSGILWSYRLQAEASIPRTVLFAGANMTWKSLQLTEDTRHDFAASAASIVIGTRF